MVAGSGGGEGGGDWRGGGGCRLAVGAAGEAAATSSQICITIRFWSICVTAVPKKGANSYWLGATCSCSRGLVMRH